MLNMKKAIALIGITTVFAVATSSAMAQDKDTKWQKNHPRREQVNHRLGNQNKRIKDEVKEGDMSKAQAKKLHRQDRKIRQEERGMASQNGGHISKQEQRTLNQQENHVSKEIGK